MKSSVVDCLGQSGSNENNSPLVRTGGVLAEKVYPLLRDFLDAQISQKQLNLALLTSGISEGATFSDELQILLDQHTLHGSISFSQLRSVLMRSVATYPSVVKTAHAVCLSPKKRRRSRSVPRQLPSSTDWLKARYDTLPLNLLGNHLLPPKLKFERLRRHSEVKNVLKCVKVKPPVAVSVIQVVPKSLIARAGN